MLASTQNTNLICFQLRHSLYPQLNDALRLQVDALEKAIVKFLADKKELSELPKPLLAQIFETRIHAINWIISQPSLVLDDFYLKVFEEFEKLKDKENLRVLADNILFALRSNQRVAKNLFGRDQSINNLEKINVIPQISFEQFLSSLMLASPSEKTAQQLIDWTSSSLTIEFVMLAADLIARKKVNPGKGIIHDLAFLVSDAAQDFYAIAAELGLMSPMSENPNKNEYNLDEDFLLEQRQLADRGIEDYGDNLEKE